MNRSLPIALAVCLALATATGAEAALTVSEQAQIKSFVAEARPASALRVRAMVARPDLSLDESSAALRDAVAPLAFTDARAAYLREVLFGAASASSRPILAIVITRAVVARADEVLTRAGGDLASPSQAVALAELTRIYAFLDADVANAGRAPGVERETSAGITTTSYEECATTIAAHVARHARVLRGDASLPAALVPVRAQLQLALLDMMNDTPTRRVDAAGRLGLAGPRRTMLTELGLLLIDAGQAEASKVDRVRAILARLPGARADVEALYYGDAKPALKARGAVIALRTPLEGGAPSTQTPAASSPFGDGDEVEGSAIDGPSAELARELSALAVKRALDARGELRAQADRDWKAAGNDPKKVLGAPSGGSLEATLAAAAELLVLDAPRTIDLAMVRALAGRPESVALLVDTLGALAAYAPTTSTPSGIAVPLGRPTEGGGSDTVMATNLKLAPAGYVTAFTFQGHTWTVDRADGAPVSVKRDGAPLALTMLSRAHVPVAEGAVWSSSGLVFAKMQGSPRAGIAPGPRVRLVGTGARGFDAIATAAPGDDVLVEGDVTASGPVALAVRAIAGREAWKGVALVLTPGVAGGPWKATIRATDDAGKETELAPAVDVPTSTMPMHVKLVLKGAKLEASVGGASLKAAVPPAFAHGDVALGARKGSSLDVAGWSVRRP